MAIYDYQGNVIESGQSFSLFINVKEHGATGNGSTDDSSAINAVLYEHKNSGCVIYFPNGIYNIKSTLILYSNQTLYFEPGATILKGSNINNLMRTYCDSEINGYDGTHDCYIYGAIFDGSTNFTNATTLVGTVHAKNIVFESCTFKNAAANWHNLEINSSYNVKVINCSFDGSKKTNSGGEMIQIDGAIDATVWPWDGCNYDATGCKYVEVYGCIFHDDTISPAIGNHKGGASHSYIRIHDNIFDSTFGDRGCIIFVGVSNLDIYNNTFNGCTIGIGSSGASYFIYGNRFAGVTTAISGSSSIAHGNMINGTYTA